MEESVTFYRVPKEWDHINVYSKGESELGRLLSNFAHIPLDLPVHKHFESMEGYWYWLTKRDDRLREEWGYSAKQLGRKLPNMNKCINFERCIKEALLLKLKNPAIHKLLKETKPITLRHYYVNDGIINDQTEKNQWWLNTISNYWNAMHKKPKRFSLK